MASSNPVKSQPLHNFDLPKWNKDSNSKSHHHRRRRSIKSPPFPSPLIESFSAPRRCGESSEPSLVLEPDLISELDSSLEKSEGPLIEYRRNYSTNSANASSSDSARALEKAKQKLKGTAAARIKENRSKILINIPCRSRYSEQEIPTEERPDIISDEEAKLINTKKDDSGTRKLRPRIPIGKKSEPPLSNKLAFKGNSGGGGGKKAKTKLGLQIPLTKREIEEDIFALTGSKPSRKPMKRPKNIQKQLDFVFPGLKLASVKY